MAEQNVKIIAWVDGSNLVSTNLVTDIINSTVQYDTMYAVGTFTDTYRMR